MSFSFNFNVHAAHVEDVNEGDVVHTADHEDNNATKHVSKTTTDNKKPAEPPAKEAREHHPPSDPGPLLMDSVSETVRVGTLPPLHFLNESVLEQTAAEREDRENILSRTAAQRSDLISGVYEGGLRVWECTYDLLELLDRDGETFGGKAVLDLGCGAALLGILALKRGARQVHFQDYNSTVIDQLTMPNVLLNCEDEEEEEEDDDDDDDDDDDEEIKEEDEEEEEEEGKGKGKRVKEGESPKETKAKKRELEEDSEPALKKRALDPSQHASVTRCRFFSGDWTTFLALLLREDPSPKYDIIFTSETIYNTTYYPALHDTLHRLLAPGGLVYIATKAHYFGVGGGLHLFEAFVEQRGVFSVDHLWDMNEGLQRHVVALRFKKTKTKTV